MRLRHRWSIPSRIRARRAVTLIELMIVLTIMSGLLLLGVPRLDIARYRADAAAQVVRTAIQSAQRAALTRQHDVLVGFDTSRSRIRIVFDANDNGHVDGTELPTWRSLPDGSRFAPPPRSLHGAAAAAVHSPGLHPRDGLPTLVFRRDGAVSGEAEIYVRGARGLPRDFRVVQVLQATGRTEWYRYAGSRWVRGGS